MPPFGIPYKSSSYAEAQFKAKAFLNRGYIFNARLVLRRQSLGIAQYANYALARNACVYAKLDNTMLRWAIWMSDGVHSHIIESL